MSTDVTRPVVSELVNQLKSGQISKSQLFQQLASFNKNEEQEDQLEDLGNVAGRNRHTV